MISRILWLLKWIFPRAGAKFTFFIKSHLLEEDYLCLRLAKARRDYHWRRCCWKRHLKVLKRNSLKQSALFWKKLFKPIQGLYHSIQGLHCLTILYKNLSVILACIHTLITQQNRRYNIITAWFSRRSGLTQRIVASFFLVTSSPIFLLKRGTLYIISTISHFLNSGVSSKLNFFIKVLFMLTALALIIFLILFLIF